jgi:hypothetical protein
VQHIRAFKGQGQECAAARVKSFAARGSVFRQASNALRTTRSTLNVDLRMVTSNSSEQPAWQRNPIFEFFASLKLAVVLLTMLIIAAIAGTLYESSFDAKVARGYVYGAPWFNLWLVLLGANLACSALSRWPWRKHHVAFLITDLGIITLLMGRTQETEFYARQALIALESDACQ